MNLVDAFVTKVISGPYEEYGKWWVDVEYISWGVPGAGSAGRFSVFNLSIFY
ncbi:TPA: hypothetical protein ACPY6O_003852 [Escherichia coli]